MEAKIRQLIREAMIEKNKFKLSTYKSILAGAQNIAKTKGADAVVTDEMVVKAVQNEMKQLNDLKDYCENDAARMAEVVEKLGYCKDVLPEMVSDEEVLQYLQTENIEKNIGACMKALKEQFGSKLDGKAASAVAKSYVG